MFFSRNIIFLVSLLKLLHSADESHETKSAGFFNFDKELFVSDEDSKFDISAFL